MLIYYGSFSQTQYNPVKHASNCNGETMPAAWYSLMLLNMYRRAIACAWQHCGYIRSYAYTIHINMQLYDFYIQSELKSQQDSVTAAKLQLLKQCKTVGNRKLPAQGRQKTNKSSSGVPSMVNTERVKHMLEMSNLREANKIAKAGQIPIMYMATCVQRAITVAYIANYK